MQKPKSGAMFPKQVVARLGGGEIELGTPQDGHDWQMIVVYRGAHCGLCRKYLARLEGLKQEFHDTGVEVVTVSGDPLEKAQGFADEVGLSLPVGYGMSTDQMQALGLYISAPRNAQETDRPYPEPGLFVINGEGRLHIADISNAPFARPDLEALAVGLAHIRARDYPVRGTWTG